MINRLSNLINRNRSAAKILQVLCSNIIPSKELEIAGLLKIKHVLYNLSYEMQTVLIIRVIWLQNLFTRGSAIIPRIHVKSPC